MPSTPLRQSVIASAKRIVIKLGTQILTDKDNAIDRDYLFDIARQITELRSQGIEITLVSSGAIGAGLGVLNIKNRPTDLAQLQAVAAVGQRQLMTLWHQAFAHHNLEIGQLLLTRHDFEDRDRYLNIRNCLAQLHALGSVPVANENDTIATDEITFGDNDTLAALMTHAMSADALFILSTVDGLLDKHGNRIDLIQGKHQASPHLRDERSTLGTGGMHSKLDAIDRVTQAGEIAVIAHGRHPNVLTNLMNGTSNIGTIFAPADREKPLDSRRRWIGLTKSEAGQLTLDPGAVTALTRNGKSLLATGITQVQGDFAFGQTLLLCDSNQTPIARGLTNYSATDLKKIIGKRSTDFDQILGHAAFAEVIHRDNLVVFESPKHF